MKVRNCLMALRCPAPGRSTSSLVGLWLGFLAAFVPLSALAQDAEFRGSAEVYIVYERDPGSWLSGVYDSSDPGSIDGELDHRGYWELQLDGGRFVLAHELGAGTDGNLELNLEQAYLSLEPGSSGRLDLGRQEVAFGLGRLFQAVDPLAGTDSRSQFDGLSLGLNPWADHGLKAVLALDGIWDDDAAEAWRRLLFGIQYDGLVGSWEPELAFFFREDSVLRIAAGSRLGLGPFIFRLEGAWDFVDPFEYPSGDADDPAGISWQPRAGTGSGFEYGGMGTAAVDLYLYPGNASIMLGLEYGYQSRGFDAQERLLAEAYMEYQAGMEPLEEAAGLPAGQWDTRHRLGFQLMAQPTDRLSLSSVLVLSLVHPDGIAGGLADAGVELRLHEDIDLFLHLRQGWAGKPRDGKLSLSTAMAGFRVHY